MLLYFERRTSALREAIELYLTDANFFTEISKFGCWSNSFQNVTNIAKPLVLAISGNYINEFFLLASFSARNRNQITFQFIKLELRKSVIVTLEKSRQF